MLSNVNTALSGFVRANNGLRFIQDRNCVLRREEQLSKAKVKLISGGGSGHEPAHNGYVGKGMLDGAVCGDVFCSPSATSIFDCLRMVAKPDESVLFVVNNYTGDRLNFGLAVERARLQYGYENLQILLNDDDCSIMESMTKKSVGKRGLAGCVLLIKILGAMAELGHSMDELIRFGEGLLREGYIATFGFTFDVIDGKLHNVELGKGLHGEPGVYKMDVCNGFESILHFALDRIAGKIAPYTDTDVVVFVNNLGGTSEFIMGVFMSTLLKMLMNDYNIKRVYVGNFFTSLNQSGLSITLLNLKYSDKLLEYLDYEVQVASPLFGGLQSYDLAPSEVLNFDDRLESKVTGIAHEYKLCFAESSQPMIRKILKNIANSLLSSRDLLNTYDKECGDGDTGNTIANGAEALLASIDSKLELLHPAKLLQDISMIMQLSIGGTSGAIYSLFFQAASKAFAEADNDPKVTIKHWLWALTYGNDAIVQYALTEVGDRTMLDALRNGEFQLRDSLLQNLPTLISVEKFARACRMEAAATRKMVPKSGRASYCATATGKSDFEYPDPGAHAVAIWAWALYEGFKENCTE
ncbi:triokinase/FMN cyclase-like [Ochlerotatus camptorhynchus]|uniref:triokinase/FMN cyclase-like n=1 Tax=Ochlerotatus camptorhynchus TaxID=644619 RepID=UPI0031E1625E